MLGDGTPTGTLLSHMSYFFPDKHFGELFSSSPLRIKGCHFVKNVMRSYRTDLGSLYSNVYLNTAARAGSPLPQNYEARRDSYFIIGLFSRYII